MQGINVDGTVLFISKFIEFWKFVNVKSLFEDVKLKDSLRGAIFSTEDPRLATLTEMSSFASQLKSTPGKREKQLTRDTSEALQHTCNALHEITKYLLEKNNKYVLLGIFTSDPLEKAFGKLRQGSGGTYFINTQQVIEKINIDTTKLLLQQNIDINKLNTESGHSCSKCSFFLCEKSSEVLDNLPELENS